MHELLAHHYSLEDIAITYTTDLTAALRRALDMDDAELAVRRTRLEAVKQRDLLESLRQLWEAISSISAPRGVASH